MKLFYNLHHPLLVLLFANVSCSKLNGKNQAVLNDFHKVLYEEDIRITVYDHHSLLPLIGFEGELEDHLSALQKLQPKKSKPELYETVLRSLEGKLGDIGVLDSREGQKVYNIFKEKLMKKSEEAEAEVEQEDEEQEEEQEEEEEEYYFDSDAEDNVDDKIDYSVDDDIFNDDALILGPLQLNRSTDFELNQKLWELALDKLFNVQSKISIFVDDLQNIEVVDKFLDAIDTISKLRTEFESKASEKEPFDLDSSVLEYFSTIYGEFVENLQLPEGEDESIKEKFFDYMLEVGGEINEEIKKEISQEIRERNKRNKRNELCERSERGEVKRARLEDENSLHSINNSQYYSNVDMALTASDTKPSRKTGSIRSRPESPSSTSEPPVIEVASVEELQSPQSLSILDKPSTILSILPTNTNRDHPEFKRIKRIYNGLIEQDFVELDGEAKKLMQTILDSNFNKAFL